MAAKLVREFLERHMKSEEIKLDQGINKKLWECGAEHPPSRIRVRAVKQDDGSVEVSIAG
jgi:large subunit ribosomal protein L31e